MRVLLTCGIGDFFAIEQMLTQEEREKVTEVYYATPAALSLAAFLSATGIWPNVQRHTHLHAIAEAAFAIERKAELQDKIIDYDMYAGLTDWGIHPLAEEVKAGKRKMGKSAVLSVKAKPRFTFPYVVIHPYSENVRTPLRDLAAPDWSLVISRLQEIDVKGVVVNHGSEQAPKHPRLIDLTNQLNFLEACDVVRGAKAFVGCSSCFSVLAAMTMPVVVKGHALLKDTWASIYYQRFGSSCVHLELTKESMRALALDKAATSQVTIGAP